MWLFISGASFSIPPPKPRNTPFKDSVIAYLTLKPILPSQTIIQRIQIALNWESLCWYSNKIRLVNMDSPHWSDNIMMLASCSLMKTKIKWNSIMFVWTLFSNSNRAVSGQAKTYGARRYPSKGRSWTKFTLSSVKKWTDNGLCYPLERLFEDLML